MSKDDKQYAWCSLAVHFSKRELEVIYHLLHGRTAKFSAVEMKISYRTVQVYLNQVRQKLRCQFKNEIFLKINIREFFDFYQNNL